jgi:hypothetical protein
MDFCKIIDGKYLCTAKTPRHCEHSAMESWECFCQWCQNGVTCGIGKEIIDDKRRRDKMVQRDPERRWG